MNLLNMNLLNAQHLSVDSPALGFSGSVMFHSMVSGCSWETLPQRVASSLDGDTEPSNSFFSRLMSCFRAHIPTAEPSDLADAGNMAHHLPF
ncbi:MAG: hypothetical protein HC835_06980 [Oscillatoriales cyanobacterium RM2_1_1]|nr:hypothetical protein [Oscillatoriales cyanobacterium SM2_3_0]NJO45386.1 hypothetical protein [Oscillatoriales cyanobacterium RM2_1_1]